MDSARGIQLANPSTGMLPRPLLQFMTCFKQVEEGQTLWQCGYFLIAWAWMIGQGWSRQRMLDFDLDQGQDIRKWVVDLISNDDEVPQPPIRRWPTTSPKRVVVAKEPWLMMPKVEKVFKKRNREKGTENLVSSSDEEDEVKKPAKKTKQ
jgi:hypothetical protein